MLSRMLVMLLVVVALLGVLGAGEAVASEERTEPLEVEIAGTLFVIDAPRGMGGVVRETVRIIEAEWPRVLASVGAPPDARIRVHAEVDLHDFFVREGLPARSPEWAAGLAIPSLRVILVAPRAGEWQRTMVHELAHLSVALAAGDGRVPRWFDEGNAVIVAQQYDLDRIGVLFRAGVLGRYLPFSDLERGFPSGAATAELAYAQSTAFTRYLRDAHGEEVFERILQRMRERGETWNHAFLAETGRSVGAAEEAWLEHVSSRWRWLVPAAGGGAAWTFMALLFLWVWRRKRAKDRERLRRMGEGEARIFDIDPDDERFGGTGF